MTKKILFTILLLLLTGCTHKETVNFGASIDSTTATKMQSVIDYQKSFEKSEKYKTILPTKISGTDITYWVDEYVDGNGKKGFEIYYQKSDGTRMATGTGSEAINRSFDWPKISTEISSSTKEIK